MSVPHRRRSTRLAPWPLIGTLATALLLAAPSAASDKTMRMSFSNVINGAMDMVMCPITGGYVLTRNLQDVDDSSAVRVAYALPGYVWLTGLHLGAGSIRTITGGLEAVPGVLLYPFDQDMDELFDPVDTASALVDYENPLAENEKWYVRYNPVATLVSIPARFGLDYTRADY